MRHLFSLFLFLLAPLAPFHSAQESPDAAVIAQIHSDVEQGDANTQFTLGMRYEYGMGVAQDYVEARKWYLKAAEQGLANAQFHLGGLYYQGHGIAQDYVKTRKWYLKAAEQGYAKAQFNLALLYVNGQGLVQDYTMAYVWYSLAAAQGNADARKARDAVAAKLDATSLAKAQKLSTEYFKRYVEPFQSPPSPHRSPIGP